jgi:hypothetical protein
MAVQRRRGTLRGSSGVECRWRPDDLDPQPADCRDERVVIWDRRGGGARERRHTELHEQPLETAGDCNRQEAGPRRGHQVSVRNTSRKRDRCSRRERVRRIADADEDLAVEHDDLFILSRVDVERQADTARLLRLPDTEAALALCRADPNDDPDAGEPQIPGAGRMRFHRPIVG